MKLWDFFLILLVCMTIMTSCSNDEGNQVGQNGGENVSETNQSEMKGSHSSEHEAQKPVSLTFYSAQGRVLDSFDAVDRIKEALPHITLNVMNAQEGQRYADLIASGTLPDIIYESNSLQQGTIIRHGFHYELDELIEKNNFDLGRFEPNILDQTRFSNAEGKLYGLPYSINRYAMLYNKDIFDRFGVDYPVDGMTWDEVYELAKTMTRVEDGVAYQGFSMWTPGSYFLNNQLSLDYLHPEEDKADINTDGWATLFNNLKRFYEIPGSSLEITDFIDGQIAMQVKAFSVSQIQQMAEVPDLDWDMASVPTFKERPHTGFKPAGLSLFITSTSKMKDAAFEVVEYMVSEKYQTVIARNGVATTLDSEEVIAQAGADVPILEGKNYRALYYDPLAAPSKARAEHLTNVSINLTTVFNEMIANQTDVNTVLRNAEETINQMIAEAKGSE